MFRIQLLLQACVLIHQAVVGSPSLSPKEKSALFSNTDKYPLPNQGNVITHDPNIIEYNDTFYLFMGGVHIPISKASSLDGPWTRVGTVLDGPSIIEKQNRTRPWAPTVVQHNGSFYCYYTISTPGSRNSSVGVATTDSLDSGKWTDHGALINTGSGKLSHIYPYNESNAIDASFIVDNATGRPYLNYGSFWHGIFQVPLAGDLLSVEDAEHPRAVNLVYEPAEKFKPIEGSWMSFREPYYYLWASHGKCCRFGDGQNAKDFPAKGQELVASLAVFESGWLIRVGMRFVLGGQPVSMGLFRIKMARTLLMVEGRLSTPQIMVLFMRLGGLACCLRTRSILRFCTITTVSQFLHFVSGLLTRQ